MKHDMIWRRAAALALVLALLSGCGAGRNSANAPAPAGDGDRNAAENAQTVQDTQGAVPPEPVESRTEELPATTEETAPPTAGPEPEPIPAAAQPPVPEPAAAEEPPAPEPAEGAPDSRPAAPADGNYTAAVALAGGTGRASVESPAQLRCENGQFWATIVWSSPNFDYMKVNGVRYDMLNTEGNSVFEIPVAAFDRQLDVIADTVAMSEPHEVSYTLTFDSASLQAA